MDLYEKAGDTFFNGSRNRDRAVEFYRVLILPSISVLCPHKAMAVGIFAPGLSAALHGQDGEGWGGSECARGQSLLQGGRLEHRNILQWLQLIPEIIWEVGMWSLHYKSWSIRCELVTPGDMLRIRVSGT